MYITKLLYKFVRPRNRKQKKKFDFTYKHNTTSLDQIQNLVIDYLTTTDNDNDTLNSTPNIAGIKFYEGHQSNEYSLTNTNNKLKPINVYDSFSNNAITQLFLDKITNTLCSLSENINEFRSMNISHDTVQENCFFRNSTQTLFNANLSNNYPKKFSTVSTIQIDCFPGLGFDEFQLNYANGNSLDSCKLEVKINEFDEKSNFTVEVSIENFLHIFDFVNISKNIFLVDSKIILLETMKNDPEQVQVRINDLIVNLLTFIQMLVSERLVYKLLSQNDSSQIIFKNTSNNIVRENCYSQFILNDSILLHEILQHISNGRFFRFLYNNQDLCNVPNSNCTLNSYIKNINLPIINNEEYDYVSKKQKKHF